MLIKRVVSKIKTIPEKYNLRFVTRNKWPEKMRIKYAVLAYELSTGRKLDIQNPVTFPEKVVWYKLFYKNDKLSRIVDKYQFKAYIEDELGPGHTIPLLGAWKSIEEFRKDWAKLPEEFCLKSNLMSDGKGIRMIHRKSDENLEEISRFVAECLDPQNTLINSFCQAYYSCTPMVLAEEYLSSIDNQLPDYKFFCFSGEPYCIYGAMDHFKDGEAVASAISFYDLDWNHMDCQYGERGNADIPKPHHLEEMILLARKLSEDFPFVRVDFFDTPEKLYLAELTFYPGGGLTVYKPESFNKELGDRFVLPN